MRCIIGKGERWDRCPDHKNTWMEHGYGFCIYRSDYDFMKAGTTPKCKHERREILCQMMNSS